MEKMLVSPSPQIRDNISTSKVMTHVLVRFALHLQCLPMFSADVRSCSQASACNGTHMGKALQSYNEKT